MGNPFVYYRIRSLTELKRELSCPVSRLDWQDDLEIIQRFYSRFHHTIRPEEFGQYVGNPLAIIRNGEIISFAIPLSFREGETEIGGVATVPERRNEGYCKALIAEMAFRILKEGKTAVLTTEKDNFPMQRAAEGIGMKKAGEP